MSSAPINTEAEVQAEIAPEQIDASCRAPLLSIFGHAAFWLVVSSVLGLIATLKFHKASFLADCPFFTYGHVQAAAFNTLLYGFVAQAAIGVMLWLIARLGRTTLVAGGFATIGSLLWNGGVTLGVIGIFIGDGSGFEWFEFPKYAAPILFVGYILMGLVGGMTFADRKVSELYPSQWFLLAALFWFPWIYATAGGLIHCFPARGVMQSVVHQWYAHNLVTVWLGSIGIAAILYFVPKLSGKALASRNYAMTTFWFLLIFGGMGGMHHGMPVPSWLPSLSTVMAFMMIAPILALAYNLHATVENKFGILNDSVTGKFIIYGSACLVAATLMKAMGATPEVSEITYFTLFTVAQSKLILLGFGGLVLLGSVYYIIPRVTGMAWPFAGATTGHFRLALLGVLLTVIPFACGGLWQGLKLANEATFIEVSKGSRMFFYISSLGDVAILIGSILLLVNVKVLVYRLAKAQVQCCVLDTKSAKSQEAVA